MKHSVHIHPGNYADAALELWLSRGGNLSLLGNSFIVRAVMGKHVIVKAKNNFSLRTLCDEIKNLELVHHSTDSFLSLLCDRRFFDIKSEI